MLGTLTKRSNIYISEEKVEMPEQNTPRGTPTNVCQTPRSETQVFFFPKPGRESFRELYTTGSRISGMVQFRKMPEGDL